MATVVSQKGYFATVSPYTYIAVKVRHQVGQKQRRIRRRPTGTKGLLGGKVVLVMLGPFFLGRSPITCEQDYLEVYKDRRGIHLLFTG